MYTLVTHVILQYIYNYIYNHLFSSYHNEAKTVKNKYQGFFPPQAMNFQCRPNPEQCPGNPTAAP
jgi:hypothetical protein